MSLRGGLIGCGFFAENHLNAWAGLEGAEIAALCDLNPDRLAEIGHRFGIGAAYSDAADMPTCSAKMANRQERGRPVTGIEQTRPSADRSDRTSRRVWRNRMRRAVPWAVIAGFLVFALFPVYWIILIAFRPRDDIFQFPAALTPTNLSLDNIRYVWFGSETNEPVIGFLGTSLIISTTASIIALAFGVACAYAIGRFRIGGSFLGMWSHPGNG